MNTKRSNQVWLIVDSLTFGGIETHLLELANGLKQHKVPVKVWLVKRYSSEPQLVNKLQALGIDVGYLNQPETHYLRYFIHLIKTQRPAVIHAHGYKASLLSKVARVLTGVKQISTYHAGETPSGKVWIYDAIDRYSAFVSNHSISVSDKISQKLPVSSAMFNNFIDDNDLPQSSGTSIAFVGRLSIEKGPDRFLKLAQLNPTLNFDVYGDGPMASELQSEATRNITFHGHQTDMAAIWENIRVLIICSRYEGLPMTALEAMGRSIPVISLDIGNLSHLIQHQQNGFIVGSMDELNESLSRFISLDTKQLASIKTEARQTIKLAYSASAVIPQLLDLYFTSQCHSDFQIEK
ncbi:glycosyltransferase family 4 protein [Vibrio sp. TBV020]|uniref:glycosyltransferase family 4 protein n=1 Tax=Vibrio sp. TBV020 TaxID=3137398 RepID=UPI0038CD4AE6